MKRLDTKKLLHRRKRRKGLNDEYYDFIEINKTNNYEQEHAFKLRKICIYIKKTKPISVISQSSSV